MILPCVISCVIIKFPLLIYLLFCAFLTKISIEQLKQLNKEEYILIDIRDAEEAFKNPIENSIVLSGESALETEFDSTKKIIVVCAQGYVSDIVAQRLHEACQRRRLHCGMYFGWKRFDVDGKVFSRTA